jgi:hypothetical protein
VSHLDIKVSNLRRAGFGNVTYEGRQQEVPYYHLDKINFGNTELRTNTLVVNRSDFIRTSQSEGFDGILGAQSFEGYWCEISFSKSKIILHRERPVTYSEYTPVELLLGENDPIFFIPVMIDEEDYYFLVDTGAVDGIFFPSGIIKDKGPDDYTEVLSNVRSGDHYLVSTRSIKILDEIYADKHVMTNAFILSRNSDDIDKNLGVLGLNFLKYYDLLLDYTKLLEAETTGMYYRPNTPLQWRNYGLISFAKEVPEFGILISNSTSDGLYIISIIKDSIGNRLYGLEPGVILAKINGKPVSGFLWDELTDPLFYQGIHDYTVIIDGIEQTREAPEVSVDSWEQLWPTRQR